MSMHLQCARTAAVGYAAKLTDTLISEQTYADTPLAQPSVQLLTSQDTTLLLLAVLGIATAWVHQQQRGTSPVPPPADAWSSSSSSSGAAEPADNRQQHRQQQRGQQRVAGMRVPPYHQSLLAQVGLTEADLVGQLSAARLFAGRAAASTADRIMYAQCAAQMQMQPLQLQQLELTGSSHSEQELYSEEVIAPAILAVFELLALQPTLKMFLQGLQAAKVLEGSRITTARLDYADGLPDCAEALLASVPAAMDVVDRDGQQYSGNFLLQPLLQMVLPAMQHVMDSTAGKAQSMAPNSDFVQRRVAVTSFASHLILACVIQGTCLHIMSEGYGCRTAVVVQRHLVWGAMCEVCVPDRAVLLCTAWKLRSVHITAIVIQAYSRFWLQSKQGPEEKLMQNYCIWGSFAHRVNMPKPMLLPLPLLSCLSCSVCAF
jgi:hypothetical protein